jgi:hypothetical protein
VIDERHEDVVIRKLGVAILGTMVAATFGVAAWRGASAETWAGVMLLMTCGVLMLAAIGAVCHGSDPQARFAGFAVFGWDYFALARSYTYHQGPLPTVRWLPGSGDIHNDLLALPPAVRIAHDAWALVFAVLGSALTSAVFKHPLARDPGRADEAAAPNGPGGWWREPAFAGLLGLGLVGAVALASWPWGADIAAGATFLLTWAAMGVAVLGAVCTRGQWRAVWIGAASFGVGYLMLAFSSVITAALPTDHFLNAAVRSEGHQPVSFGEDPVMIAGHSLLALAAAAFGGVGGMLARGRH